VAGIVTQTIEHLPSKHINPEFKAQYYQTNPPKNPKQINIVSLSLLALRFQRSSHPFMSGDPRLHCVVYL
jgi:hypothetical protein